MNFFKGISRTLARDGAERFIDQLFFKNTYFPEHLWVAMTDYTNPKSYEQSNWVWHLQLPLHI